MSVEIQPVHREAAVIGLEGLRGAVVAVRICVLGGVPEDAVVGFVDEDAGGEVDAGDCVVVVAAGLSVTSCRIIKCRCLTPRWYTLHECHFPNIPVAACLSSRWHRMSMLVRWRAGCTRSLEALHSGTGSYYAPWKC